MTAVVSGGGGGGGGVLRTITQKEVFFRIYGLFRCGEMTSGIVIVIVMLTHN